MQKTNKISSKLYVLAENPSIGNTYIAEIRDVEIQTDRLRFRRNLERIGECLAFELSKTLKYVSKSIQTPLGIADCNVLEEQPVLGTILRAGLPLHQGVLNVFDRSSSCFIGAYRKVNKGGAFSIQMDYVTSPDLNGKALILCDPMLATGQSLVLTCKDLKSRFKLKELHIISAIASTEGVEHVKANLPEAHLWIGAIDNEMTSKSYIVPGLGDAGDLAFGEKL